MARTTIDIADPILAELRDLQRQEGRTLGSLASELLADALTARRRTRSAAPAGFAWTVRAMGVPRVDIDDKDALHALLDAQSGALADAHGNSSGTPPQGANGA